MSFVPVSEASSHGLPVAARVCGPGRGTLSGSARVCAIVGMPMQNTSTQFRSKPRLYGLTESRCRKCSYVVMLRLQK